MNRITGPVPVAQAEEVPHGRTAQRLQWPHLPADIRALVERRLGSPVATADSQGSGFTPGFASRLVGEDGSRLFVKAASRRAQANIAQAYAEEARKLRLLPTDRLPAPQLSWFHQDDLWVVLGFEDVAGRPPRRPWAETELDRCLEALVLVDEVMSAEPAGFPLHPLHEELPTLVTGWDAVAEEQPAWPHLAEVQDLAHELPGLPHSFVHGDARDDNFVLADDGRTLLCDWNWPALGPRWVDVVDLLATAHAEGCDVESRLRTNPLTAGVPDEHVDVWLAALCGFMVEADGRPVPPSSPYLGVHRRWWAAALWAWLAERRGWDA